ncbi:hypothetical protein [Alkalicoccus halolimnae]|uniref:Uncharacterized protein n=1 Tax=Alkalicoccus halolimnae TaxID=1667239 RepID=A0A5C7FIG3_9BACI|nr:hypothetical protein [Alkalicoccus halolimnae]TXF85919.1 hypothetical protein FTX54_07535 [Alkalicoccus halolimnae]
MDQKLLKITIFLSSYSPVFYLAAFQLYEDHNLALSTLGMLCAVVTVITAVCFRHAYKGLFVHDYNESHPEATSRVSNARPLKNSLFTAYTVSFFLPIMNTSFASITDTLTFILIFILLFVISVQTSMYYFNPLLLIIFGYQAFEARIDDLDQSENSTPRHGVILTKQHLDFFNENPDMQLVNVKDGLYYHKKTLDEDTVGDAYKGNT